MSDDLFTLYLTAAQRSLLLEYESDFSDPDLFRLIAIAMKKSDTYQIHLTFLQAEELMDEIADLANDETNEKRQQKLDDLFDTLESIYDVDEDDLDDDDDELFDNASTDTGPVYILKVKLAQAKKIWRSIAIRQGHTLHDLHEAIFAAFDRYDEHCYSFFFPMFPAKFNPVEIYKASQEYTHPLTIEEALDLNPSTRNAAAATLGDLNLVPDQTFYYLFDFGDEWWHEIQVQSIDNTPDEEPYPRVIKKQGDSPPQYPVDDDYDDDIFIDDQDED